MCVPELRKGDYLSTTRPELICVESYKNWLFFIKISGNLKKGDHRNQLSYLQKVTYTLHRVHWAVCGVVYCYEATYYLIQFRYTSEVLHNIKQISYYLILSQVDIIINAY